MNFKVDKKIPVPTHDGILGRPRKYPWLEMKIDDSFVVIGGGHAAVRSAMSCANRRYDRKFISRKVAGGVRIWRVA